MKTMNDVNEKQEGLDRLKLIVESLPDHNPGVLCGDLLEMKVHNGVAFAFGLMKIDEVAVANTVISDRAEFDAHYHCEKEFLVVYSGELHVWLNVSSKEECLEQNKTVVVAGGSIGIDPYTPHIIHAPVQTRIIAITIPASKNFPDATKRKE